METCASNNIDYWEELSEQVPSLPKLRGLASNYVRYSAEISSSYAEVRRLLPENYVSTANYLHYLLQVGVDVR